MKVNLHPALPYEVPRNGPTPVFISDLVGENEIKWDGTAIVIGRNVDAHAVLFEAKLTWPDRCFLRSIKVAQE